MKITTALPCAVLALLLTPLAAAQTTWYVDAGGTPPGTGTPADPYVTIQLAVDAAAPGDTVLVAPGDYVEHLNLPETIVVRGTGGPLATTLTPPSDLLPAVTLGDGTFDNGPTLEGFTIRRDPPRAGTGVLVLPGESGLLTRCVVTGFAMGCFNNWDLWLESTTVAGNDVGIGGDAIAIHVLENAIVQENGQDLIGALGGPCIFVQYACFTPNTLVFDCSTPVGGFDADPLFWDAAGGDFHLRLGSPCIDTGDPLEQDPDGSRIDLGAIPYDPAWAPGTDAFCFGSDTLCPCGNGGSGAGGCEIPQGTGGVALSAVDFDPDGAGGGTVEMLGEGYPPASLPGVTLIRSPASEDPPVVFGDGLRCISAAGLVRVRATLAVGGRRCCP